MKGNGFPNFHMLADKKIWGPVARLVSIDKIFTVIYIYTDYPYLFLCI